MLRSEHSLSYSFDVSLTSRAAKVSVRARPLSVEDRQSSIISAVLPLLLARGRDVTSKQIAEAAGIAEGTVFRAFGDKDSLIDAAIARILDPEPLRRGLKAIPAELPLNDKVYKSVVLMQNWFGDVVRVMASVESAKRPKHEHRHDFVDIVSTMLAPDLELLNVSPAQTAQLIRLVSFASAVPHLNDTARLSSQELTDLVLYGIAGQRPTPATESQD